MGLRLAARYRCLEVWLMAEGLEDSSFDGELLTLQSNLSEACRSIATLPPDRILSV